MAKVMMQVRTTEKAPSLGGLQQRFSLTDDEIDLAFGVVEVDPGEHLFTFLVEENAVEKCHDAGDWEINGPFSNPRIAPFGPPKAARKRTGE